MALCPRVAFSYTTSTLFPISPPLMPMEATQTLVNSMGSQAVMLAIAGDTGLSSLQEASCFFSCQESSK